MEHERWSTRSFLLSISLLSEDGSEIHWKEDSKGQLVRVETRKGVENEHSNEADKTDSGKDNKS